MDKKHKWDNNTPEIEGTSRKKLKESFTVRKANQFDEKTFLQTCAQQTPRQKLHIKAYKASREEIGSVFGAYLALGKNQNILGMLSVMPYEKNGQFFAYAITDILKRGLGCGTALRKEVINAIQPFLGKEVLYGRIKENTLSGLYYEQGWHLGGYCGGLKSALNMGCGIACMTGNTVQMFYPYNSLTMWSQERKNKLLTISEHISYQNNKENEGENNWENKQALNLFVELLNDFDFSQETDIVSFLSLYLNTSFLEELEAEPAMANFVQELSTEKKTAIMGFTNGKKSLHLQKISIDVFDNPFIASVLEGKYEQLEIFKTSF